MTRVHCVACVHRVACVHGLQACDASRSAFPVGSERDIVCFEALLLVMLAIGTQNILLACFLTYIISGVRAARARVRPARV